MRELRYRVVDVFTDVAFAGNPLAVFPDARGLADDEMQAIAGELNLSETTFVFAPESADALARVRIFTPKSELPFAGHPTIGTAYVLVVEGRVDDATSRFVLAENVGPVPVRLERRDPFLAWLETPPIRFGAEQDAAACAHALGVARDALLPSAPPRLAGAGNPFLFVALREAALVDAVRPDLQATAALTRGSGAGGLFVFAPRADGAYSRMFAPALGIVEDPATGSAVGPLGAYLLEYGLLPRRDGQRFTSEQGTAMGRRSLIYGLIRMNGSTLRTVEVGGSVVPLVDATMTIR